MLENAAAYKKMSPDDRMLIFTIYFSNKLLQISFFSLIMHKIAFFCANTPLYQPICTLLCLLSIVP